METHTTGKKQSEPQRAEGQRAPDATCPEGHTGTKLPPSLSSTWSREEPAAENSQARNQRTRGRPIGGLVRQTTNQQAAT